MVFHPVIWIINCFSTMVKNIKEGTKYNEKKVQDKKWTKNKIV